MMSCDKHGRVRRDGCGGYRRQAAAGGRTGGGMFTGGERVKMAAGFVLALSLIGTLAVMVGVLE